MSTTTTTRARRSTDDWDTFAAGILPKLMSGGSINDFRDEIGSNMDAVRTALARQGFDVRGNPIALREISARSPKTLATRVAKRRRDGAAWWLIKAETGKSYGELIRALEQNGWTTDGQPVASNGAS